MRFLAVFFLLLAAFASLSAAVDISACTALAASTAYRLTASITNAGGGCMNVTNSGASLDLNGFTIDGAGNANTWGINVSGVTSFVVENGTVKEFDKLLNIVNSSGVKINNMTFVNATGTAPNGRCLRFVTNANGDNLININVTNSTCTNTTEDGMFIGRSAGSSVNIHTILIQNNTFKNTTQNCIWNVDGNVSYNNNTFDYCQAGAMDFNNPGFRNITNNIFRNGTSSSLGAIITRSSAGANFIINNNFFYNLTKYLNNSLGVAITYNNTALGFNASHGIANWTNFTLTSQSIVESTNVIINASFISVNSSNVSGLNSTANIRLLTDSACTVVDVYRYTAQLPTTAGEIVTLGSLNQTASCSSGIANFNVTSFTGYALGPPLGVGVVLMNSTSNYPLPEGGVPNISTILNLTYYDEATGLALNITNAAFAFNVWNSGVENTTRNYSIIYTGTFNNSTIRAYPNYTWGNISSIESYSVSGYTTRNRFMVFANTSLNVTQNISVYLLPDTSASYSIINVVNNGNPVQGAYVSILKFFATSSSYTLIDQKITNAQGQAAGYYDPIAYYKFLVYDGQGNLLYTSSTAEQFICDTTCQITINVGSGINIQSLGPYPSGICYGNATTNFIHFVYSDSTGLTQNITFLAWRAKNYTSTAPVCNNTVSASSGGYNCNLTAVAGENLSLYPYYCEVRITASPERPIFGFIIDLVGQLLTTDWLFPGLAVGIIAGAAGLVSPVIGLAAVGVGMTGLYLVGILPLTYTFVVYILVAAGMLIFLKAE